VKLNTIEGYNDRNESLHKKSDGLRRIAGARHFFRTPASQEGGISYKKKMFRVGLRQVGPAKKGLLLDSPKVTKRSGFKQKLGPFAGSGDAVLPGRQARPYPEMMTDVLSAGRGRVLAATGVLLVLVAAADWYNAPPLGVLYVLPMMLSALALTPPQIVALALLCSLLVSLFDVPTSHVEHLLRFSFAAVSYTISGLFASALMRNRRLALDHLQEIRREQARSHELEEQLRLLVESSPAAILTADGTGAVLASNRAADSLLLGSGGESLVGRKIDGFVPLLAAAVKLESRSQGFRTVLQCPGRRANGEVFLAHAWFSCYATPRGTRMAAIIVDSSEEMRDREEEGLRQLIRGNRIAAAAVSHEVRNMCSAILLVSSNLQGRRGIADDEDFERLMSMVGGLEKIASGELLETGHDRVESVPLAEVLDDLRIVIQQDWLEIGGSVVWDSPPETPAVLADRHGLLQAFLNLAKNSRRAVQDGPERRLRISVSLEDRSVQVRFQDSGPGLAEPERLFHAFQGQSDGSGLGLYISRAMLRSYGGDISLESAANGTTFRVDLQVA
jgi:two-component system sensor kinase FixL